MAELTRISWTDHTFNPWTGCQKVSHECDHCYAEAWAKRAGRDLFGGRSKRKRTTRSIWARPRVWNRIAGEQRRPRKVFCASLADVFEDAPGPNEWRPDVWDLIRVTPWLDWQLLTKRPENIAAMLPEDWGEGWPHVWLGTSVGHADHVDRLEHLRYIPAAVRFVSAEPLLGPLINSCPVCHGGGHCSHCDGARGLDLAGIDWLIAGGESGAGHRPMEIGWAQDLREACSRADVAFFFKQIAAHRNEQGDDALGEVIHEFPASWDRSTVLSGTKEIA